MGKLINFTINFIIQKTCYGKKLYDKHNYKHLNKDSDI
jgi:hypothetical protein